MEDDPEDDPDKFGVRWKMILTSLTCGRRVVQWKMVIFRRSEDAVAEDGLEARRDDTCNKNNKIYKMYNNNSMYNIYNMYTIYTNNMYNNMYTMYKNIHSFSKSKVSHENSLRR